MRLLICAGGTGGGVYPALSVLQALQAESSQEFMPGRTLEVMWVGGAGSLEEDLVKREQIPFTTIPAAGIHGVSLRTLPKNIARLAGGFFRSRRILRDFKPDVLLFTGGYLAVPMALASRFWMGGARGESQRVPRSLVYIPDVEPGWALKALLRMADQVALTVEETRAYLPGHIQWTVTGYPLRRDLLSWKRPSALQALQLEVDQPVLLVIGGSRGARSINRALFAGLPQLLPQMQVLHISGQQAWAEAEQIQTTLPAALAGRYHPFPYLHAEMGAALAAADLVLSRAGASCLGEYPAFGLPAILAPYPHAWRYQQVNAEYLVQHGAAVLVQDEDLMTQFVPTVQGLMNDKPRRQAMAEAMRRLAKPDAAHSIAKIIVSMAESAT